MGFTDVGLLNLKKLMKLLLMNYLNNQMKLKNCWENKDF